MLDLKPQLLQDPEHHLKKQNPVYQFLPKFYRISQKTEIVM